MENRQSYFSRTSCLATSGVAAWICAVLCAVNGDVPGFLSGLIAGGFIGTTLYLAGRFIGPVTRCVLGAALVAVAVVALGQ